MTPGQALTGLRDALATHGTPTAGMTLARHTGLLYPSHGPAIGYHYGLYWWPARRLNASRPLYTIHDASDPAGAARRITASHQPATSVEERQCLTPSQAACQPATRQTRPPTPTPTPTPTPRA